MLRTKQVGEFIVTELKYGQMRKIQESATEDANQVNRLVAAESITLNGQPVGEAGLDELPMSMVLKLMTAVASVNGVDDENPN